MFPLEVAQLFAARHGVAARRTLVAHGLTLGQIDHLVRVGLLQVVQPGVYRLVAVADTFEQRLAALCAIADDVVISHTTSGRVLGLHPPGAWTVPHVTIDGARRRAIKNAIVHYSFRMDPIDVIDRGDGIRITSPPRIAFDLAATLTDRQLLALIEEIFRLKLCTFPTLVATLARLRERGRTGSVRLGRVLASRPAWRRPPGSTLEARVEDALVAAGLPRPERNAPIRLLTGEVIHPDLSWGLERAVLEVDHVTWHGGGLDGMYDKWRDRQLARLGILPLRVTDTDVEQRLPDVVDEIGAILRMRGERTVA